MSIVLWVALVSGILADHLITEYGIRKHGLRAEGNPIFRSIEGRYGGLAAMTLQAAVFISLLWISERYLPEVSVLLPLFLWAVVVANILTLARKRRAPVQEQHREP